ncbi:unnamed protein product [Rotaria sp. Silwood2]|nr:unnamed protein product [Rotaria sp. Silwood2]
MTCSMDSSQNTSQQETHRHRYEIRQKPFSFDDNFTIKNEVGQDVYKVRSKIFSFGDKLVLENMNGKQVDHIIYNLIILFYLNTSNKDYYKTDKVPIRVTIIHISINISCFVF